MCPIMHKQSGGLFMFCVINGPGPGPFVLPGPVMSRHKWSRGTIYDKHKWSPWTIYARTIYAVTGLSTIYVRTVA